jgi:hypothetical protein
MSQHEETKKDTLASFVNKQVSGLTNTTNVGNIFGNQSIKTTRRSTYAAPIEVIPEEGIFAKSFIKGFGDTFKPVKPVKLNTEVEIYDGLNANEFLTDEDGNYIELQKNSLLDADAQRYFKEYQSLMNKAVRTGNVDLQNQILRQVANDKEAYFNLKAFFERASDDELYDAKVSSPAFLDVNGNQIKDLSLIDFAKINNSTPENITKSRMRNSKGVMISGFDVKLGDKVFFINTQEMTRGQGGYLDKNFKVNFDFQSNILAAKDTDELEKVLKSPPKYETKRITDSEGFSKEVNTTKISDDWYQTVDAGANIYVNGLFSNVTDEGFASAFAQVRRLIQNDKFKLDENINSQYLKDGKINDADLKNILTQEPNFARQVVADYAKQQWLINKATVGYKINEQGRAVKISDIEEVKTEIKTEETETNINNIINSGKDERAVALDIFNLYQKTPVDIAERLQSTYLGKDNRDDVTIDYDEVNNKITYTRPKTTNFFGFESGGDLRVIDLNNANELAEFYNTAYRQDAEGQEPTKDARVKLNARQLEISNFLDLIIREQLLKK